MTTTIPPQDLDRLVSALRTWIKNYSGDVRSAFYAMTLIYGSADAARALNEYEERKWIRTANGDKWAMIVEETN